MPHVDRGHAAPRPHLPTLPCPRCGAPVPIGARFCPNCAFVQPARGAGCLVILLLVMGLLLAGGLLLNQGAAPRVDPPARTATARARPAPTSATHIDTGPGIRIPLTPTPAGAPATP